MTVAELLDRIIAAYPGATPEAMKTFKPVFYARLRTKEGDGLEAAANEVLASFRPKHGQPFPIPADFEAHMVNPHKAANDAEGGSSIRTALEARSARARKLYAVWHAEQGLKIKAARHSSIYGACVLLVLDLCRAANERTNRVVLTAAQISECEMRALSAERAHRHRPARTNERWDAQIDEIRSEWAQPKSEAAA